MATIKLNEITASNIYLGIQSLQAADEYFNSAASHAENHFVENEMLHAQSNIKLIISRLEKRVPKSHKEAFQNQILNNDPLRIQEINRLYTKLLPDEQEAIENIMIAMRKGEKIKVEFLTT